MTNDKQRERLIELRRQAMKLTKNASSDIERDMIFADYLLANGVIVPPCKVGDKVWCNIEGFDRPLKGMIRRVSVSKDFTTIATGVDGYFAQDYLINDFGKKIFLTKEEAEKALNNVQNGNSCEGGASDAD